MLVCQIFNVEFLNGFHFFYELLKTAKEPATKNFNETHVKFFILIYHLSSKIIENREQTCLIKEFHHSLKNSENSDFLETSNEKKFADFLIKKSDFITLMEYFNDSIAAFLNTLASEPLVSSKEDLSQKLNFLNILIKVV